MLTKRELEEIKLTAPDAALYAAIQRNWDAVAKPLDSMGEFEPLLSRIGAILGDAALDIKKKAIVVMCADNGIVEEHISQSGQEVTAKVAASMGRRTSSVCRMAAAVGADVFPIDIGMSSEEVLPGVENRKVRSGTGNFLREAAMTEEETLCAIETGMQVAADLKRGGYKLIATGEMGIGNTTTSSAVAAALLSCDVEEITGRGAGLSDAGLSHKIEVIRQALRFHALEEHETLRILSMVGGLDIAGLTGVFIGGALYHVPIVIDGVISAVAALCAERLVPGAKEYVIPSHCSREPAAHRLLTELGVSPVIDAGLALGEGTGAVMMLGLLDIARTVYGERTTFADIDMEPYERFC